MEEFNIIEYLSGLTSYTFDKSLLVRVALDRGVSGITQYVDLTQQQKDLCKADLLYSVYIGANSTASYSVADGTFKESVGSQTINDKKYLYGVISSIYAKYGDENLSLVESVKGNAHWVDENEYYL